MVHPSVGSVMVAGGGIGWMQTALRLSNSGYSICLEERASSIGGVMSLCLLRLY